MLTAIGRSQLISIALAIVFSLVGWAGHTGYLSAIAVIHPAGDHHRVEEKIDLDYKGQNRISMELQLEQSIEAHLLQLVPSADGLKFRAEIAFETSMTVQDEGPHLDLTEWKHFRSGWHALVEKSPSIFAIPSFSKRESSRFPRVSHREMLEEIKRMGGDRWASLIKPDSKPGTYPLGVGISKYLIRISVFRKESWVIVTTIELRNSMGC